MGLSTDCFVSVVIYQKFSRQRSTKNKEKDIKTATIDMLHILVHMRKSMNMREICDIKSHRKTLRKENESEMKHTMDKIISKLIREIQNLNSAIYLQKFVFILCLY